jgi:UDP-galactopyranose mutase
MDLFGGYATARRLFTYARAGDAHIDETAPFSVPFPPILGAADIVLSESPMGRAPFDVVVLSHLRWNFVYQRPQHLLSRCARRHRVFFVEEPILDDGPARMETTTPRPGVWVAVPHLPEGTSEGARVRLQRQLLDVLMAEHAVRDFILWYYTPMAIPFTRHLAPSATIYDCMDELSAFAGAPEAMRTYEKELFVRADLVFTGGQSLYESKRTQHPRVFAFPSSVDTAHFAQARDMEREPADQASIPHPRLGFFGVIDERMDLALLAGIAAARPEWRLVIIGPVVKVDPAHLPRRENIHYLGMKDYGDLPAYLAGWDVALLPFARNASTRFISPTKTPEYLAAGTPVVSTAIRDVVRPYGERGLVHIADTVEEFVAAVECALEEDPETRLRQVDAFLGQSSWDRTWDRMRQLIENVIDTSIAQEDRVTGVAIATPAD